MGCLKSALLYPKLHFFGVYSYYLSKYVLVHTYVYTFVVGSKSKGIYWASTNSIPL